MDPNTRALIMGAAGAGSAEKIYVEDVFSTWLYTGNGSTQTITNGIDLAGKGGLVWLKTRARSSGDFYSRHFLYDSARGLSATSYLHTDAPDAQGATGLVGSAPTFLSNGFTPGPSNLNTETYASWTFRKAAKFFDVVTYTGNSQSNNTIIHNLGSAPGAIIIKTTTQSGDWVTLVRKDATNYAAAYLNLANSANDVPLTEASSTTVNVGRLTSIHGYNANTNGVTYVAYLFAHDAGGFGDSGNESVIKCGSFTQSTSTVSVNLGWEPQWVLIKSSSIAGSWYLFDNMRGMPASPDQYWSGLKANAADAESPATVIAGVNPTGFTIAGNGGGGFASGDYIYIAIRRGPMKTPTDATKVFAANSFTAAASPVVLSTGFPVDLHIDGRRDSTTLVQSMVLDRLRGQATNNWAFLRTSQTVGERTDAASGNQFDRNLSIADGIGASFSFIGATWVGWSFRRAPEFFDVVAYTGTQQSRIVTHSLKKKPQLIIVKCRSSASNWIVYSETLGALKFLRLNTTDGELSNSTGDIWGYTEPTSTAFTVADRNTVTDAANFLNATYIAYLFASCPGVSKVGSYTGTGATLSIDCGFTNGARFVMIKRTDVGSTGDWYVWDTARGIVSGNDSYLLLNSTAEEVTNTDYIDPLSSGFQISSTAPAAINANGGSFIYLAVA